MFQRDSLFCEFWLLFNENYLNLTKKSITNFWWTANLWSRHIPASVFQLHATSPVSAYSKSTFPRNLFLEIHFSSKTFFEIHFSSKTFFNPLFLENFWAFSSVATKIIRVNGGKLLMISPTLPLMSKYYGWDLTLYLKQNHIPKKGLANHCKAKNHFHFSYLYFNIFKCFLKH